MTVCTHPWNSSACKTGEVETLKKLSPNPLELPLVTLCDTTAGIGKNGIVMHVQTQGQTDVNSQIVT